MSTTSPRPTAAARARLGRLAGCIFAVGGLVTLIGNVLHPSSSASSYHAAIADELANGQGGPSNWLTLIGSLLLAWSVWTLLDHSWREDGPVVQLGARLTVIGSFALAIEGAVALAMRTAATPYAAGRVVPMVRLSEVLYAAFLPALMLGVAMVVLGNPRLAPRPMRVVGLVGTICLGLAGPLVDGTHHIGLWPLYLGGVLICAWIIWAGVGEARRAGTQPSGVGRASTADVLAAPEAPAAGVTGS